MASNHKKNIDQLFKSKLESHASDVPESVWSKISAEMDQEEVNGPKLTTQRKKNNLSWVSAIAAGLLLFGFIIWKVQPDEKIYLTKADSSVRDNRETPAYKNHEKVAEPEPETNTVAPLNVPAKSEETARVTEQPVRLPKERLAVHTEESTSKQIATEVPEKIAEEEIYSIDQHVAEVDKAGEMALARVETSEMEHPEPAYPVVEPEVGEILTAVTEDTPSTPLRLEDSEPLGSSPVMPDRERPRILSGVLNFVANNLKIGDNTVIEFSETEHGILHVDVKGVFDK